MPIASAGAPGAIDARQQRPERHECVANPQLSGLHTGCGVSVSTAPRPGEAGQLYAAGMEGERKRELQLPEAQLRILSFAVNSGVWGPDTRLMFRELCVRAKEKRPSAELYGWAAMTWPKAPPILLIICSTPTGF